MKHTALNLCTTNCVRMVTQLRNEKKETVVSPKTHDCMLKTSHDYNRVPTQNHNLSSKFYTFNHSLSFQPLQDFQGQYFVKCLILIK